MTKVKVRRFLVAPLCFTCPNFAHEWVKGVGWTAWCKDKNQDIRTSVDPTPREPCQVWKTVIAERSRELETPEAKEQGARLKLMDDRHAEADKILASGKIDLNAIKDSVVRRLVIEGLEKQQREVEHKKDIEGQLKRQKEIEDTTKRGY